VVYVSPVKKSNRPVSTAWKQVAAGV
jgi:hypothetical protein